MVLKNKLPKFAITLSLGWLLVSGCVVKDLSTDAVSAPPAQPSAYVDSVTMAQNPTPAKVFAGLVSIVPDNAALTWKRIGGQQYVLMSTYSSTDTYATYYKQYLGKSYPTGNYNIWVTAVPYLQETCRTPNWSGGNLGLRIEQLLGLPANSGHDGFIQIWVRPEDMFRPCPDNEVTDDVCGLNLPEGVEPWYRQWFNDLRAQQYTFCSPDKQGYPWTQLGYTFDWYDLSAPVGMSEFVIKKNVNVIIEGWILQDQYCATD